MTKSAPHLISTLDLYQTSGLWPSVVGLYIGCDTDFSLFIVRTSDRWQPIRKHVLCNYYTEVILIENVFIHLFVCNIIKGIVPTILV